MPRSPWWLHYAVACTIVPTLAAAQDSPRPFSYATYFECDPAREARADELMRGTFFPIFDRHLAAKRLVGWGWLAHNLGGHWRRVGYMSAPTREAVLDAQNAILKDMRARAKEFAELSRICPRHEDYIWQGVAASQPAQTRTAPAPARYSTYFECEVARQSRADSITLQAFAPIYSRYVKEGGLSSWAWLKHVVGGKYRRLMVLDGGNHQQVLASADSALEDIAKQRSAEGTEFGEICRSHQDYLWDVQAARP